MTRKATATLLLIGAVLGAIVAIGNGFSWGGWRTLEQTRRIAAGAVTTALTPVCRADYIRRATSEDLRAFKGSNPDGRRTAITGTVSIPEHEKLSDDLVNACAQQVADSLMEPPKK